MNKVNDVDAYISGAPEGARERLVELRKIIKDVAPESEERISYGMPFYGYKGRLAYFAYFKHHIGLYLTPPVLQDFKKELAGYETATATVRFPLDKELPVALIRKLIKARMKLNDELSSKKKSR